MCLVGWSKLVRLGCVGSVGSVCVGWVGGGGGGKKKSRTAEMK